MITMKLCSIFLYSFNETRVKILLNYVFLSFLVADISCGKCFPSHIFSMHCKYC